LSRFVVFESRENKASNDENILITASSPNELRTPLPLFVN
jgi:hypothetical protein